VHYRRHTSIVQSDDNADIKLGPGIRRAACTKIVEGMFSLAKELGVKFLLNCDVTA